MPASKYRPGVWRIFPLWAWVVLVIASTIVGWFAIPLFFGLVQMIGTAFGWVLHA